MSMSNQALPPPQADPRPVQREMHGYQWTDPYAWLRSARWQEVLRDPSCLEPDIRAYLEAENAYTDAEMADTQSLQAELFAEYRGRMREDDSSVPEDDGPWSYYTRYAEGGEHPRYCRRQRHGDGTETILFDGDEAAKGHGYFQVGSCEPSPSHDVIGVATDTSGAERWMIRFKRLADDSWFEDTIEGTSGTFVFVDDTTIFYTVLDEMHRPRTVRRHQLGTAVTEDEVVYHEEDPGFFVSLSRTESQRYVVIDTHDHRTSEARLVSTTDGKAEPVLVAAREVGVEYEVSDHEDKLLILTNANGAEDFSLRQMPLSALGEHTHRTSWTDILPHQSGQLLLQFHVFAEYLVVLVRINGLPQLKVYSWAAGGVDEGHTITFSEEVYSLSLMGSREYRTKVLRFAYSSMTTPRQVYDYTMDVRDRVLRKTQEIPSGHRPEDYVSRRLMVPSYDGELVPVSILHRKDTPIDGSAPLLLYGYGSYGISTPAGFSITRLSLVDRGFVYAIAHVRGGKERGYRWYRAGKLEYKENTFRDFIAAAEGLIDQKFAHRAKLMAYGGSAGGMLMGVVVNLRPDLFHAVAADVPFVDVLNTMLDDSLPLTPPEWPEWGNPLADREAFERILGYCPYDNVCAQSYPHMLVMAGLSDPRVTYWEPAKWVARLRATSTGSRQLLLRTHMEAGHGGASGRLNSLKEVAFQHAFFLNSLAG
ncbi:MAG: S9 family peptidase [Myxococcales bacterium]|nr:S9 family peptidase [Myxococcales bacterium]